MRVCALVGAVGLCEGGRGEGVEGGKWVGSNWVGVASSLVCKTSSSSRDIPRISPLAIALRRRKRIGNLVSRIWLMCISFCYWRGWCILLRDVGGCCSLVPRPLPRLRGLGTRLTCTDTCTSPSFAREIIQHSACGSPSAQLSLANSCEYIYR